MAAIETDGLTKRYGDVLAIDDLDLTVEDGEVFGFLGPNGAGKSTTISLLLDFLHPTAGEARVFGLDSHEESMRIRQRVGVLPENAAPYDRLTGREHLELAADCKGVDADLGAVLDRVGLDQAEAERAVRGYSTGMAQRLGIGMALVGEPDLLILDEPSAGLDPTGMAEMRTLIRSEVADGTTVFFSSHHLGEVEAVCDRVGILDGGELVVEGDVGSLREELLTDSTVEVTLARGETAPSLEPVDGVVAVEHDGQTLRVTCERPATKSAVVASLHEQTTVRDVVAEPPSMEAMFERHTGGDGA
jgi:ABC-2 type transport system ATP-binding protein